MCAWQLSLADVGCVELSFADNADYCKCDAGILLSRLHPSGGGSLWTNVDKVHYLNSLIDYSANYVAATIKDA